MANSKLLFFNKRGEPLNFEYTGPTGPSLADANFLYTSDSVSSSKGLVDISDLNVSNKLIFNEKDINGFDIIGWGNEIADWILKGTEVTLSISILASSNKISGIIESITVNSSSVELIYKNITGNTYLSNGKKLYFETTYKDRPNGYYKGSAYFDEVSAGLFENFQIFVLQEFREVSGGPLVHGYPHADISYTSEGNSKWRTRWDSDAYGNVDVTNIIFNYKIQEGDSDANGDPVIYGYPNVVYETAGATGDYYEDGYIITSDNIGASLGLNIALNTTNVGADVYERKLIIEELIDGDPVKVMEIDFYGQVTGEDERLDVLTRNLGRAFLPSDSPILRNHDPAEPFPDYVELNEKRKELMVAGEEIFPYIGSYKGLINALRFFGYQDLRIKEYWLNIRYNDDILTPLQSTSLYLDENKNQKDGYTQNVLIKDVLDNQNSGKYKLTQTYGPNSDGKYVLDVSSENTILPNATYKKTSFFGLYYDLLKVTDETDPYGYPITEDAFMFSQEEVILKLFALKERLKKTYLPLNARIIDITGEGVYFNIYNTKAWTDSVERFDIDSGFTIKTISNPDFGFIEDLSAFNIKSNIKSIQTPTNYDSATELDFTIAGPSGDAYRVDGYRGNNPDVTLRRGSRYIIKNNSLYPLLITRDPLLTLDPPYGIENNGATAGTDIIFDVSPEESTQLYYYSDQNTLALSGKIATTTPAISDLGNISNPLANGQEYTADENQALLDAISNFYRKKQDGDIIELGDNRYDPTNYIDPDTGTKVPAPIGMPVILELALDEVTWDDLSVTWDSLEVPIMHIGDSVTVKADDINGATGYIGQIGNITDIDHSIGVYTVSTGIETSDFGESSLFSIKQDYSLLTWDNIDFSNYVEIEWNISKSATQSGDPYNFSFRGPIMDFYKLAHFLPLTGKYQITCYVYDSYNYRNIGIINEAIEVSPRSIDISAWTRYHESEEYTWDEMVRPWDEYKSPWQYIAEGNTYDELRESLSYDALNFINYGNSAYEGQNATVKVIEEGIPAAGHFTFTQEDIGISQIISYRVGTLSQYSIAEITTETLHGFVDGDTVFIRDSLEDINGDWPISIPSGATGYTFTIPKVIEAQAGVEFNLNYLLVDPAFYPNQLVSPEGRISVSIDGRVLADLPAKTEINATISTLISKINKTYTTPDYVASTDTYGVNAGNITITSDDESYEEGNGLPFDIITTGSLSVIFTDTELHGGLNPTETYVEWEETDTNLPNENLRFWGTKRLTWDDFGDDVTWDSLYAHTWDDFEYNNEWLGGFELYGIKAEDHLLVSTSSISTPFPIGLTFDPGILTIGGVAEQLNNSNDENITNFYYRAYPAEYDEYITTAGPTATSFSVTVGLTSAYPAPATVPGANPVNFTNFTYAT